MQREFMERLAQGNDLQRRLAWEDLINQPEVSHGLLTVEDRQQLHDVLRAEEDDDLRLRAMVVMLRYGTVASPAEIQAKATIKTLDGWFSQLFDKRSALYGITEMNFARRDEDALVHVARRFPPWLFPDTDVNRVLLSDNSWQQALEDHVYDSILLVGRLWLFGDRAIERLQCPHPEPHLMFPEKQRPAWLEPGKLDPNFHCIREQTFENGEPVTRTYQTGDGDDRFRTDYGIVQVYPVFYGSRQITVVVCAGCSTLGTLAAARWLTYDLGPGRNTKGNLIPAPRGIKDTSRMEALVKASAPITTSAWQPSGGIELCRLYVDDQVWSREHWQWQNTKRKELRLTLHNGEPDALYVDGVKVPLMKGSQNYHLTITLVMSSQRDASISLKDLANNADIWDGHTLTPAKAKQRLRNLNNTILRDLLIIADDRVEVNANVTVG
jgi:hypothetical protein